MTPGAQPTLAGLPQFLRYLSTFPASQDLFEGLFRGPLARLEAQVGQLWRREGDELVGIAHVGPADSVGDRYMVLPLQVDMPLTRSVLADVVSPTPIDEFLRESVMELDADLWSDLLADIPIRCVVNIPLTHAGELVGALGFGMTRDWEPTALDPVIVEAVRSALAVWITHPATGFPDIPVSDREWSLTLSYRQVEALRLVRRGWSGAQIATALGVSPSAVKHDLTRAMKAMRTKDRMVAAERAQSLGLLDG